MTERPTIKPLGGQMLTTCLERLPREERRRIPMRWVLVAGVIAYVVWLAATRS